MSEEKYVLFRDRWAGYSVGLVERAGAKEMRVRGRYGSTRVAVGSQLAGPSTDAARLRAICERLVSSQALADDEKRKADERHRARAAKIILEATAPESLTP